MCDSGCGRRALVAYESRDVPGPIFVCAKCETRLRPGLRVYFDLRPYADSTT